MSFNINTDANYALVLTAIAGLKGNNNELGAFKDAIIEYFCNLATTTATLDSNSVPNAIASAKAFYKSGNRNF